MLGLLGAAASDARVSAPLEWSEVESCEPADFTVRAMPERYRKLGDPHLAMDRAVGWLEPLLELAARTRLRVWAMPPGHPTT